MELLCRLKALAQPVTRDALNDITPHTRQYTAARHRASVPASVGVVGAGPAGRRVAIVTLLHVDPA
jgi:hypothetical protein